MAASLSIIAAKDGTGATIVGGIQALDLSGAGTGPWSVANILVDGVSGTLRAAVTAANALKTDGSAVTQPVSGTVTANAGTNMSTASLALETGGNLATIAGAVTSSVVQANLKQVNGVTTLAGAGASGTGAQRVTVSQDTTTVAGSAPGTAGTASVNVLTVQGVASMTPVQVSQATAASLNATVVQSGTWSVRSLGNAGGVFDAVLGAVIPANAIQVGGSDGTDLRALLTNTSGNLLPISKIWDGTNTAAVKAASTAPLATDAAVVVAISPNSVNGNGQAVMASSAPVAIASNQSTLAVAYDTSQIFDGATGTTATITKSKISVASATTTTVVALTASKKIRVFALYLVVGAANNLNWQSHTTTSNADGVQDFAANGGIVLPFNPLGWFDTTSGEALDLVTSTSAQVGGYVITAAV